MLTIDALKDYGANVEEGLQRCVNKEALYLRLVKMVPGNEGFQKLAEAVEANDLEAGFQAAHGLKGICANLALTPLLDPVVEMTELFRAKTETDYRPLLNKVLDARERLAAICAE